jgi:hypothetical protein
VIDSEIYGQKDTMTTAGKMIVHKRNYKAQALAVDSIGIGAGIVDRLRELGEVVFEVNSGSSASDKARYRNLRAEMWEIVSKKLSDNLVSIPNDETLIEQLLQVKYKTIESNGRLQVEGKDDLKKRLGRSPDRADALVMGLYAVDLIIASNVDPRQRFQRRVFMTERFGY